MRFVTAVLASALVIAPAAMVAQTTTTPTPGAHDYNIGQRKVDQQDRIAQGVKSGQLTAGETSRLEHQEAGINKEERGMRAQDHGHLTSQDRKTLHAQQNQESRRIYRDKHNAAVR
jgi:methionine-rich copper-binding protein CopC